MFLPRVADRIALSLSVLCIMICWLIAGKVFDRIPHIEDEMAYSWQAQTIARGDLTIASPSCTRCFLVPFVVDHNGLRFGKYPPGWPAMLSLGIRFGIRDWINPSLAGLSLWLVYLLAKRIKSHNIALLAVGLTLTSPFFLINASSLLSHTWSLFLVLVMLLSWLDSLEEDRSRFRKWGIPTAGMSLGLLVLSRPLTALGIAIPFFIHGIYLLIKGSNKQKLAVFWIGLICAALCLLYPLWQYAVTGDPFQNPYTLWWPYDRIGFGVGIGTQQGGFQLSDVRQNLRISLKALENDLLGWGTFTWFFLLFGFLALYKKTSARLAIGGVAALIFVYIFYWIGSALYGPRYYFEAYFGMILATTAGAAWFIGKTKSVQNNDHKFSWQTLRFIVGSCLILLLILNNLFNYLPQRLSQMHALYGISQMQLNPFEHNPFLSHTPALVFVHIQEEWTEYGGLLDLTTPYNDTPFIFALSQSLAMDHHVALEFPDRSIWHYYPDHPDQLFEAPLP